MKANRVVRCVIGSLLAVAAVLHAAQIEARLPNGRRITPDGGWITVAPYPFALAVRPDGRQIVVPCIGWPYSLTRIDNPNSAQPGVARTPVSTKNDPEVQVHAGVAYSPDGREIYDATGDSGAVDVWSTETWQRVARIPLNGTTAGTNYGESFAANLVLSRAGRFLYVIDQGNWRLVVIDTAT